MFRGERNLFSLGAKILLFIAISAFLSVLMLQSIFWRERKLYWNSTVLLREGLHVFFPFPGLICLTEQCSLLLCLCPLYNIIQECFQTLLEMRERMVLSQKSCSDTADKVCCIKRNVITGIEVVCLLNH